MIKPTLLHKTSLQQSLTPQQIHYLKLLQLPILQLEHAVRQEIESNPFLEEDRDDDISEFADHDIFAPAPDQQDNIEELNEIDKTFDNIDTNNTDINKNDFENFYDNNKVEVIYSDDLRKSNIEEGDSFDYYENHWEDDDDFTPNKVNDYDKDFEPFQIKSETSLYDELIFQQKLLNLSEEENILGLYIIGSIDDDGYLRRDLEDIVNETNEIIKEHNFNIQKELYEKRLEDRKNIDSNPAINYSIDIQSLNILNSAIKLSDNKNNKLNIINNKNKDGELKSNILQNVSMEKAELILKKIQHFEPIGIASRNLQECLIVQLEAKQLRTKAQEIALKILIEYFEEFSKKHFLQLQKKMDLEADELKIAFDEIRKLNPKPGGNNIRSGYNTITPDFIARYDVNIDDIVITLNDTNVPSIKVNSTYEKIKQETKNNKLYNKDTKKWIREKYENARFFIQAIRQRSITMLMVMTAIAKRQKDFFMGIREIKPMIYKDISEDTDLDISTVCRVVNNKYVLTQKGTFELKYFFSEALPNDDGEAVSTTVIKEKIINIIENEPKNKPYSDDKLVQLLKKEGINIARRTITKYRETLKIPVARLRKEI